MFLRLETPHALIGSRGAHQRLELFGNDDVGRQKDDGWVPLWVDELMGIILSPTADCDFLIAEVSEHFCILRNVH